MNKIVSFIFYSQFFVPLTPVETQIKPIESSHSSGISLQVSWYSFLFPFLWNIIENIIFFLRLFGYFRLLHCGIGSTLSKNCPDVHLYIKLENYFSYFWKNRQKGAKIQAVFDSVLFLAWKTQGCIALAWNVAAFDRVGLLFSFRIKVEIKFLQFYARKTKNLEITALGLYEGRVKELVDGASKKIKNKFY